MINKNVPVDVSTPHCVFTTAPTNIHIEAVFPLHANQPNVLFVGVVDLFTKD